MQEPREVGYKIQKENNMAEVDGFLTLLEVSNQTRPPRV